jgi:hypothetical protein
MAHMCLSMNDLDWRWPGTIVMLVALICSGSMHTDWVDHSICHVSTVSNGFKLREDIPPAEQPRIPESRGRKLIGFDMGSAHVGNSVEVLVRTEDMLESF